MSDSKVILVTGASSFIGSHVVLQLLKDGYKVKGSARGGKVAFLRNTFGSYPNFEAIEITNIVSDDFIPALQGVHVILHFASPGAARQSQEETVNSAIEGTLHVLRQAVKAGVPKVVLTSSFGTALDPSLTGAFRGITFSEKDWGETSREDVLAEGRDPLYIYCGAKILAEKAAWKFAAEHRELDLTTINPPFVYGAPLDGVITSAPQVGSHVFIWWLLDGAPGRPLAPQYPPSYIHVRDVVDASIRTLALPPVPAGDDVQKKRFFIAGPGVILWAEAAKTIQEKRPALAGRLPTLEGAPPLPGPLSTIDTTRAADVLGLKKYVGAEETLLETVDALIALEKTWE